MNITVVGLGYVSAGTERHMLEMAKKSLAGKALARPDLVRQVIARAVVGSGARELRK